MLACVMFTRSESSLSDIFLLAIITSMLIMIAMPFGCFLGSYVSLSRDQMVSFCSSLSSELMENISAIRKMSTPMMISPKLNGKAVLMAKGLPAK